MKIPDEIRVLKKDLRSVNRKLGKLEKANEKLRLRIEKVPGLKKKPNRKNGYYNWMENERRLRNILMHDD